MRLLFFLLIVAIAFAAGAWTQFSHDWMTPIVGTPSGAEPPVAGSGEGSPSQKVMALGRLEPEGGIVSIGVPLGDRLDRVVVKEGDDVCVNDELAFLESHEDRLADQRLAASQLQEAQARYAALTAAGNATVHETQLHLEQVRLLEPLDLQVQEAKVRLIQAQLESARADWKRLESLQTDSVPQQKRELQQLAVRQAKEELAGAQALSNKLTEAHKISLRTAQAQLETARANLRRYQSEIPLESLKNSLALAESRLKHTVLRAPRDGRILKILAHAGEPVGTRPILQLGDAKHMLAIAEVYETDRKRVRPQQRATITSPALPGPLTGTVVQVGNMIAKNSILDVDPTAATDHRVVEVQIRLDPNDSAADFINLKVTIEITPSPETGR